MVLDAVSNFVRGNTDAEVGTDDTTVSVSDASIFPDPATDGEFNVVIWDANNFPRPDQDSDVEIVRVTGRDTGTNELTVVRAQETTSDVPHPEGSAVHLSPTAKMFSDIENTFADFWDSGSQTLTADVDNGSVSTDNLENKESARLVDALAVESPALNPFYEQINYSPKDFTRNATQGATASDSHVFVSTTGGNATEGSLDKFNKSDLTLVDSLEDAPGTTDIDDDAELQNVQYFDGEVYWNTRDSTVFVIDATDLTYTGTKFETVVPEEELPPNHSLHEGIARYDGRAYDNPKWFFAQKSETNGDEFRVYRADENFNFEKTYRILPEDIGEPEINGFEGLSLWDKRGRTFLAGAPDDPEFDLVVMQLTDDDELDHLGRAEMNTLAKPDEGFDIVSTDEVWAGVRDLTNDLREPGILEADISTLIENFPPSNSGPLSDPPFGNKVDEDENSDGELNIEIPGLYAYSEVYLRFGQLRVEDPGSEPAEVTLTSPQLDDGDYGYVLDDGSRNSIENEIVLLTNNNSARVVGSITIYPNSDTTDIGMEINIDEGSRVPDRLDNVAVFGGFFREGGIKDITISGLATDSPSKVEAFVRK